jgi:hypothetical protein
MPTGSRLAAASRISLGVGTSRDGRQHFEGFDPKTNNLQAGLRILGLRWKRTRLWRGKEPAEAPMQTHETSLVLGASVMGMTYGACQGLCYLSAGVPGISATLG